ncbi:hypothetical protein D3C76_1154830 [compost metagenome]
MTLEELSELMVKHGLVIRAIPNEKTYGVPIHHKDRYSDEAKYTIGEVYKPDNLDKELITITERFSKGGKFIIAKKANQDSTVQGWEWNHITRKKVAFYDTIEQAIESLLGGMLDGKEA